MERQHIIILAVAIPVAVVLVILMGDWKKPKTVPNLGNPSAIGGQAPTTSLPTDPSAQLREIAERGKAKAAAAAGPEYTFIDVKVDVIKTSSLLYPFIGRIVSDWRSNELGHIDRIVVYFKYDNNRWVFSRYDRGTAGGVFPGTLTEDRALNPSSIPQFNQPHSAAPKFTIWLP